MVVRSFLKITLKILPHYEGTILHGLDNFLVPLGESSLGQ